jgi:hypothetical protein
MDKATQPQVALLGAQEHHLLVAMPYCIGLVMMRVSGAEQELLRSICEGLVKTHAGYCEDAHGLGKATSGESRPPIDSVIAYHQWHTMVMHHKPLPFALGALSVMYGNSTAYDTHFEELLAPYRVREDLIEEGAKQSCAYTVAVWDALVSMLTGDGLEKATREATDAVG